MTSSQRCLIVSGISTTACFSHNTTHTQMNCGAVPQNVFESRQGRNSPFPSPIGRLMFFTLSLHAKFDWRSPKFPYYLLDVLVYTSPSLRGSHCIRLLALTHAQISQVAFRWSCLFFTLKPARRTIKRCGGNQILCRCRVSTNSSKHKGS